MSSSESSSALDSSSSSSGSMMTSPYLGTGPYRPVANLRSGPHRPTDLQKGSRPATATLVPSGRSAGVAVATVSSSDAFGGHECSYRPAFTSIAQWYLGGRWSFVDTSATPYVPSQNSSDLQSSIPTTVADGGGPVIAALLAEGVEVAANAEEVAVEVTADAGPSKKRRRKHKKHRSKGSSKSSKRSRSCSER
ncbi:hypothetical protein Salat_1453800 [Sesamum alatum]|uniref:Uncharacterized protein n=1 Tax=Sesamum alatum TaxID=300844 RepID=A0AAE1YAX1_9LAMI|nr:hypothetical protein Salat_1453800 [Sesamum alatum]